MGNLYQYVVNGQRIELNLAAEKLAVRFREPAPNSIRTKAVAGPEIGAFENRFEVPGEKYTIFDVARSARAPIDRLARAVESLRADPNVDRATPVFAVGDAYAFAGNRLMIGFSGKSGIKKLLKDYQLEAVEQRGNEFLVEMSPERDAFEVMSQLADLPQVDYVEPDFVNFGRHVARPVVGPEANDPLVPDQYAVHITQASEAWKLQSGDSSIRIAILDEGVDTQHEDLSNAIVGNYDGVDNDTFQEPKPWDAHGTSCAGLAAAVPNNETGIRGVGGGCSLMGIRIAYSSFEGGNWSTTNAWIRRAIDWSWENGADILSNSWGGGAPSSAITNAFLRARTQGRSGKGCVIVIAAGNANSIHDFPGNLDDVLTVSASNEFDEPKTPTSQDGEHWWGSNFGPKIDVAAPGVHNYTTDNSGTAGYNDAPAPAGNYSAGFNGTSSATPIVAGAAGLVLSVDPLLTEAEVRGIIRKSADKVGPLPYVDGRNDRMGHGRLNVLRAIQDAGAGQGDQTEVPTGMHAPVSNIETDSEIEVASLIRHVGAKGQARSAKAAFTDGREDVGEVAEAVQGAVRTVPDTSALRNIAEASYGAPVPHSETVHGEDNRVQIHNTQNFPWRVHASLLITAGDGSRWIGTGWFLGPHTLGTAGHVVYITNSGIPERNGWVREIQVIPGRDGSRMPYTSVQSEVFHTVVGWTEHADPQYDYAAINIPGNLGDQVGKLGFGVLSRNELLQATGNLAGYPGDKPDGTQWYHHNTIASVTSRKVFYDIDTAGGQSGAAVYHIGEDGERTAFGIHAYGGASTNSATRITTPVYQNFINWSQT